MSLKLAISITGDASSLKSAVDETKAAIGSLSQTMVAADAKVEAAAETAAEATDKTAVAIEAVSTQAATAATNVVQFSAGLGKAEASAKAVAAAVGTASAAVERLNAATVNRNLGVKDDFGGAVRAADIAAYGKALDTLQARFDPLAAAGQRYRQALLDIAEAERVGALGARAGINARLEAEQAYRQAVTAREALDRRNGRMAESIVGAQTIVPDRGANVAAYGKGLDDLRAKYNPLFAAQRSYLGQLGDIRQAEKVGALSQSEASAAIGRTKAAFAAQVLAIRATRDELRGATAGMEAWRKQQLLAQGFDVFTSLGSGMNPATVAIQQGPQIIQAYGGIGATLKGITALVNPLTIGIGAATAAVALGVVAWNSYDASVRNVGSALDGLGRGSGATRGELEAIAVSASASASISIKSAREMEAAFLRTGRIGVGQFDELLGLAKDFGATIGTDAAGGAGKLAELLGDPASGARNLQQIGLIDGATARLAVRLAEQNRLSQAQAVILDGLPGRLAKASEATSIWARAWEAVATGASNAFDRIGRNVEQMTVGTSPEAWLAELKRQREGDRRIFGAGLVTPDQTALDRQITDVEVAITEAAKRAAARAQATAADRAGSRAIELANQSPANADQARRKSLSDVRDQIQAGVGSGTAEEQSRVAAALDAQTRAIATYVTESQKKQQLDQIDLQTMAARDPLTKAELAAKRVLIELQGQEVGTIEAGTRAEAARAMAVAQSMVATRNQIADLNDEADARKSVLAQVIAGSVGMADVQSAIQAELAVRPLLVAAMKVEGAARQVLTDQIDALRKAYADSAEQQKRAAALSQIAGNDNEIARLQAEIILVGQSAAVRTKALAVLEAEQRIRQQGIEGTAEAARIREQAAATADLTEQLRRRQAAEDSLRGSRDNIQQLQLEVALIGQSEAIRRRMLALLQAEQQIRNDGLQGTPEADRIKAAAAAQADLETLLERQQGAWDSWRDEAGGAIDTVVGDLATGKAGLDTLTSAAEDAAKWLGQLAIANPLKNALLGENLPTITDVWDRLSGKSTATAVASAIGSSVGSMTVTAATVVINGGIGSLIPGLNVNENGLSLGARGVGIGSDFAAGGSKSSISAAAMRWAGQVQQSAAQAGVDPRLALAVLQAESGGNPTAKSGAGAIGLMQLMPGTAAGLGVDPHDPLQNIRGGVDYLSQLSRRYGGDVTRTLAAYNWGPGRVDRWNGDMSKLPTETQNYVSRVTGLMGNDNAAAPALEKLATSASAATRNMGQLGAGVGDLTASVQGSASQLGKIASGLIGPGDTFGGIARSVYAGLGPVAAGGVYDIGGYTGPGGRLEPAGIVHRGEVVWSQDDIRRAGGVAVVEGMRRGLSGYASGGVANDRSGPLRLNVLPMPAMAVARQQASAGGGSTAPIIKIVNNHSGAVGNYVGEQTNADGQREFLVQIDEAVGTVMDRRGGKTFQQMGAFGLRPRTIKRGG